MARRFYDPEGTTWGIPTYPRHLAPRGLATRYQLRALGLRPGGQEPVAQLAWASRSRCGGARDGYRVAWLYYVHAALPVRPMTPARERALARAYLARCTCTDCGRLWDVCLPTSTGRVCPTGCEHADQLMGAVA